MRAENADFACNFIWELPCAFLGLIFGQKFEYGIRIAWIERKSAFFFEKHAFWSTFWPKITHFRTLWPNKGHLRPET